jgi:2,4-dienoyl-CoA reductase-like NADH-dependent reductase (Old Yellow Enzyme family)
MMMSPVPADRGSAPDPFSPFSLGRLWLKNRIVKAATFEGMCPGGAPSDALVDFHRGIAAGGAAMTTVAYCSVSPDGRSYATQMLLEPAIVPGLKRLTDAVHREGAAASIQLGHCGYFADRQVIGGRPLGASRVFNTYGLSFPKPMDEVDLTRVIADFARAATLAREAGFDLVELHFGHGYLVSQFLSPFTNRRSDRWGGALENRLRLATEVLRAVRQAVGVEFPVLAKTNLRDGFAGGLEIDEAVEVARALEAEGVTGLVLSGGFVSRTPLYMLRGDVPLNQMIAGQERLYAKLGLFLFGRLLVQRYPYEEAFFRGEARRVRQAVRLPLMLLGGIKSRKVIDQALQDGFELVGMARALLHDATLPRRLERGEVEHSGCVPCNECIAEMDRGGVRCTRRGVGDVVPVTSLLAASRATPAAPAECGCHRSG